VAWTTLVLSAGPSFADALADRSRAVQAVASVALWLGWAGVLAASLVPRAETLTLVRLAGPAALAAAIAAAASGSTEAADAVALAGGALAAATALFPGLADAFVDGSSYGDERRFALRSPPALAYGAAPVAWLLAVPLPATGALLLAAGAWVAGAVVLAAGLAGAALGVPALHRLSRRWLVFVPAGLVVHDHLALADPVLLRRPSIRRFGPAPAGTSAHDLTLGAGGLALEIAVHRPTEVAVARGTGRRREAIPVRAAAYLVTPLRPGAVLGEARRRRYAVATAEPTTASPS
jgi:hypothetical protein